MMFVHLRPQTVARKNKKDEDVSVYPDSSGVTLCIQFGRISEDEDQWASLGWCLSSPSRSSWDRKKSCSIAGGRLRDSPLQFRFEALREDLTLRHVLQALRTLTLEAPKWEFADEKPVRPGRFNNRVSTALLGPDGSLLTAYVDVKVNEEPHLAVSRIYSHQQADVPPKIHWAMRAPRWAHALILERG